MAGSSILNLFYEFTLMLHKKYDERTFATNIRVCPEYHNEFSCEFSYGFELFMNKHIIIFLDFFKTPFFLC